MSIYKQRLIICIFIYLNYVFMPPVLAAIDKNVYKYFETPAKFKAESTIFLNEVAGSDKEAGFKIKSELEVEPVWRFKNEEFLLKFQVSNAKVWVRKLAPNAEFMPHPSVLDQISLTPFLVFWEKGHIVNTFISDDDVKVINYKKSLASLFQFQTVVGEKNETDATGTCDVLYETVSDHSIRKIKSNCHWSSYKPQKHEDIVQSNYITAYKFTKDGRQLQEIFADEVHRVWISSSQDSHGVKARGWVQLTHIDQAATKANLLDDFGIALEKWGPLRKGGIELSMGKEDVPKESPAKVLKSIRTALLRISEVREDDIGTVEEEKRRHDMVQSEAIAGAEALSLLARAFRSPAVTASNVQKIIENEANSDILLGILLSAGASGSNVVLAGVLASLKSDAPLHRRLFKHYLLALATSTDVTDETVWSLLGVCESGRDADTKTEAMLCAAAASTGPLVTPQTALSVKEWIVRSLSRCADGVCRATHYRALGNLRRTDTLELLLQAAEKGDEALDALDALTSTPRDVFLPTHLTRLAHIVMAPRPTDLRAAALLLALTVEANQEKLALDFPLAEVAIHLEKFGPMELKRLLWQIIDALEIQYQSFNNTRHFLVTGYDELKTWNAMAHGGLSSALSRRVVRAPGGGGARLWSLQTVSGGALTRGLVRLHTHQPEMELLTVDVRTRGLQSLNDKQSAGEGEVGVQPSDSDAPLSASLYLGSVCGARAGEVRLFAGQGELLGHVWGGTAASPTRAALLLRDVSSAPHAPPTPSTTGALLDATRTHTLLLDLVGQAHVSLWNRVADTKLHLQSAVSVRASIGVRAPEWSDVGAATTLTAAPALTLRALIDFHDDVALCVAVNTHRTLLSHNITKWERVRGGTHYTQRNRHTHTPLDGHTLALDTNNNRNCRDMV